MTKILHLRPVRLGNAGRLELAEKDSFWPSCAGSLDSRMKDSSGCSVRVGRKLALVPYSCLLKLFCPAGFGFEFDNVVLGRVPEIRLANMIRRYSSCSLRKALHSRDIFMMSITESNNVRSGGHSHAKEANARLTLPDYRNSVVRVNPRVDQSIVVIAPKIRKINPT